MVVRFERFIFVIKKSMGSFYSTCSVSSMTLTHQKVARLLLVPSAYCIDNARHGWELRKQLSELSKSKIFDEPIPKDEDRISYDSRKNWLKQRGLICCNNGSQSIFSPFGFPIFGEYDDYGNICNIEHDNNVELLESFFGCTIETLLEDVQCGTLHEIQNELWGNLTFTDIRREIYDFLSNKQFEHWAESYIEEEILTFFDDDKKDPYFHEYGFIPQLCRWNFLKIFKIDKTFEVEYRKMYQFILNMNSLNKLIFPSYYGGQDTNWKLLTKLNSLANDMMNEDIKQMASDE